MNRTAIAFSTCDRVELSRQSIEPLLDDDRFDVFWNDGSKTDEGKQFHQQNPLGLKGLRSRVTGGSGPAIVFALSQMLAASGYDKIAPGTAMSLRSHGEAAKGYEYIALLENDVVIDRNWFDQTMVLFEQGKADGLEVGAVSARCYEDRILIQRPGYAICHNLGAGMIVFTREAAELVLNQYRVQWTSENRQTFATLTGSDIGKFWAFRGQEHFLVADWRWDALLASRGLASLALTPSPVQMIGQIPPLEQQGLTIATGPVTNRIDDSMFNLYRNNLHNIRLGNWKLPDTLFHRDNNGGTTIFAHQIGAIGGHYQGKWKLKDAPGFGPFGWIADSEQEDFDPRIFIPVAGPCEVMVSGGSVGGQIEIVDEQSGFNARPILPAEGGSGTIVSVNLPGNVSYRTIRINMMTPGCCFYGIRTHHEQPRVQGWKFDWNTLPHGRVEL
jgi:hypothetical protein